VVRRGRGRKRALAVVLLALFVGSLAVPLGVAAQDGQTLDQQLENLGKDIGHLDKEIERLDKENEHILLPVTILVSVLAAGGLIGIVFSIRDQRRVSQLQELTVTGETSAQRRAEETYTSFFEASQKTLNLVNETLGLAKEATERSAQETRRNAEKERKEIEAKAEEVLLPIIGTGIFENVVVVQKNRLEVERVAGELANVEGYLKLQDIEILPYSRFVKGIAEYLHSKTRTASRTLHRAARDAFGDGAKDDLKRFALYWAGALESHLGDYERAIDTFGIARADVEPRSDSWFELERIFAETRFFERAQSTKDTTGPRERYGAVARLLETLANLDQEAREERERRQMKPDLLHEIAAIWGDVYTWIAHDPERVYFTLGKGDRKGAGDVKDLVSEPPEGLNGDPLRAWVLRRAKAVYVAAGPLDLDTGQEGADFEIEFGKAHCDFALKDHTDLDEELHQVERLAHDRPEAHHEPRKRVEFAQTMLICKCWRLELAKRGRKVERDAVRTEHNAATTALGELRDHEVMLFSQVRRRNVPQEEFRKEMDDLRKRATGDEG
jgi:tetratricopeptide (TPR) repeat protein